MKMVYYADPVTLISMGARPEPDGYQLKSNESFDNPSGLQSPQKLTSTGWVAATDEENKAYLEAQQQKFLAETPQFAQPNQPADDKGDQALNLLGQQLAKVQAQQATLASSVNALGQMVAKAQAPKQA
ncbi:hypothetical protein [Limosilactobacillus oris]|uniref:hypothetical protein n=1 Tax=Limosilactobacillus oris TaxID=1632 RepID=UPI002235B10F|nr:hypothetical protein [Limosilactobacillus oris]MCW4387058.1 hypothetical protein [Limosilactobacillus oris]